MSKHIPIDNCSICPYYAGNLPYCLKIDKDIPLTLDEIPEWCPLENYQAPLGERPEALCGPSYEIKMDNDVTVQININELEDGTPFEVFIQNRGPVVFEWITAVTILVTTLLRSGYPLKQIGMELEEIPGPESGHIIPGTDIQSPSFISRVGRVLRIHAENKEKQK